MVNKKGKIKKGPIKCFICKDAGLIPRGYKEPLLGVIEARQLVQCFKCRKEKTHQEILEAMK